MKTIEEIRKDNEEADILCERGKCPEFRCAHVKTDIDALLSVIDKLKDGNVVHMNILRGDIVLSREQALHIAGATDHDSLKATVEELRLRAEPQCGHYGTHAWRDLPTTDTIPPGHHDLCEKCGIVRSQWEDRVKYIAGVYRVCTGHRKKEAT